MAGYIEVHKSLGKRPNKTAAALIGCSRFAMFSYYYLETYNMVKQNEKES